MIKDHSLKSALNLDLLKIVYNFSRFKKIKLYLVGGILRDWLLGKIKENPDIDFCLKKGAISFGRNLAKKLKAGFVVLDKEHGACRLVKRIKDKTYTLDFTDFRGPTLKEDLLHRDFTINALAMDLEKVFFKFDFDNSLIDLHGGRDDLKQKVIRLVNKNSFLEDIKHCHVLHVKRVLLSIPMGITSFRKRLSGKEHHPALLLLILESVSGMLRNRFCERLDLRVDRHGVPWQALLGLANMHISLCFHHVRA